MDYCSGAFGSEYTGKLAFTDLSAKILTKFEVNKDHILLDGWLKTKKYEADIYHYLCNCPVHSPSIFSNNVNFIYADSLTQVANTAHDCNFNSLEYVDEIEESNCDFPSHLGDEKIQFVCAMDFETTDSKDTSKSIATTESYETSFEKAKRMKAEIKELANHETIMEDNIIKTKEGTSDPYS